MSEGVDPSRGAAASYDAHPPHVMAELVEEVGIRKATLPLMKMAVLAVLAGAFIAFGAMFYTVTVTGSTLGLGPTRLLGGISFSLGLILVIVGGAELFTGNSLIVMAWVDRRISLAQLARNWTVVLAGNLVGAVSTAWLAASSGVLDIGDGAVLKTAHAIAVAKLGLSIEQAFLRGILCNVLVCLAVWLCFACRSVVDKIFAILLPIGGFVAVGFEHSIANMYLLPVAALTGADGITPGAFLANLVPVTLGNVVGGGFFVGFVYWLVYRRS